jgi:hypothetical protein
MGLANVGRIEHILALKNDVFPFNGADMLQKTDVDIFAFRNTYFQNAGDFLGLPIDGYAHILKGYFYTNLVGTLESKQRFVAELVTGNHSGENNLGIW